MNKNFIKKNLVLISFLIGFVIMLFALLVLLYFEHASMEKYDAHKSDLLKQINAIFEQDYVPVKVNVNRMKKDALIYNKKALEIQKIFGHPYAKSLQAFVDEVGVPLDKFKEKFNEFWEERQGNTTRDLIFQSYKVKKFSADFPKHKSSWSKAMNAFMNEAQKQTLQELDIANVDGLFLEIMGKGRTFGGSVSRCEAFMNDMRKRALELLEARKVECEDEEFSFGNTMNQPREEEMPLISRSWDIVGDLIKRISKAKEDIKRDTLEITAINRESYQGREDGEYLSYRITLVINGDMATIRRVIANLYKAYEDKRVYAVRNISISRVHDEVDNILMEAEVDEEEDEEDEEESGLGVKPPSGTGMPPSANTGRRSSGRSSSRGSSSRGSSSETANAKEAEKKKAKKSDKDIILKPGDKGYAKIIVGAKNLCTAKIELDYIVFVEAM